MAFDPLEAELDESYVDYNPMSDARSIQHIETLNAWVAFRGNLTQKMWNEWQASRIQATED